MWVYISFFPRSQNLHLAILTFFSEFTFHNSVLFHGIKSKKGNSDLLFSLTFFLTIVSLHLAIFFFQNFSRKLISHNSEFIICNSDFGLRIVIKKVRIVNKKAQLSFFYPMAEMRWHKNLLTNGNVQLMLIFLHRIISGSKDSSFLRV